MESLYYVMLYACILWLHHGTIEENSSGDPLSLAQQINKFFSDYPDLGEYKWMLTSHGIKHYLKGCQFQDFLELWFFKTHKFIVEAVKKEEMARMEREEGNEEADKNDQPPKPEEHKESFMAMQAAVESLLSERGDELEKIVKENTFAKDVMQRPRTFPAKVITGPASEVPVRITGSKRLANDEPDGAPSAPKERKASTSVKDKGELSVD